MSIEDRIALAKDLIRKREEIDQQLSDLFGGGGPKRQKCSICGGTEHTARTCPHKASATTAPRQANPLPSSAFGALPPATTEEGDAAA